MLYSLHAMQRSFLEPVAALAGQSAAMLQSETLWPLRILRANCALLHRLGRRYPRPAFGVSEVTAHGRSVAVTEQILLKTPFCRLVRFARSSEDPETAGAIARAPRVLLCAPLSGHHPTLLRDTVTSLLADHDVYITDWIDASQVPVSEGPFHLDDYVVLIQDFIRRLGAGDLHVIAVCQPTVPVLAAVALLAAAGEATPRTLTLMGGPIDARRSPTAVNQLATEKPFSWFESNMIHRVAANQPGAGRAVYPGFLQLTAFVMMNPDRHLDAYRTYWLDQLRGAESAAAARVHERFYDEYNAVLDMDASYYLDTVRTVFQEFALARGTWEVGGQQVRPEAISTTALLTIEGALDDISGPGQTAAAHDLCSGIPAERKRAFVADQCGHYGLFSGNRWRTTIYPQLRAFVSDYASKSDSEDLGEAAREDSSEVSR